MTKQDILEHFKDINAMYNESTRYDDLSRMLDELQEPCGDCISRQAVINAIANTCFWLSADNWKELMECINSISPVSPQPKMGRWVFVKGYEGLLYECTACKNKNTHTTLRWNYCPNCGAKMVEP